MQSQDLFSLFATLIWLYCKVGIIMYIAKGDLLFSWMSQTIIYVHVNIMSDIPKEITSVCALPTTSVCALPTTSVCALPTTSVCALPTTSVCALPTPSVCALPTPSVCALPTPSVCALPIRMLIFYINQKNEGFTTLYII